MAAATAACLNPAPAITESQASMETASAPSSGKAYYSDSGYWLHSELDTPEKIAAAIAEFEASAIGQKSAAAPTNPHTMRADTAKYTSTIQSRFAGGSGGVSGGLSQCPGSITIGRPTRCQRHDPNQCHDDNGRSPLGR
jgi:hypothetical protein